MTKNTQPDPGPLKKIVAEITAIQKAIADAKIREAEISKEVHDYLKSVDPNDKEAIQLISARRTQVEIYPHWFKRAEETLQALVDPLYEAVEKFTDALLATGREENAALVKIYDERIEPFFPGGQKGAAAVCPSITSIPTHMAQLGHERLAVRNQGIPQMIASGLARANELLGFYEAWKKAGDRWRPEIWKRLEK